VSTENKINQPRKGPAKGTTNNPNGRPPGTKNRSTSEMKKFLFRFLKKNRKKMQEDWEKLTPYQRIQMTDRFMVYVLPKVNEELTHEEIEAYLSQIRKTALT
jgi:hypothetical protein